MFELETKTALDTCEKLLTHSDEDVRAVGGAVKALIIDVKAYADAVVKSEEATRLLTLEVNSVSLRNENLSQMLAAATKYLEVLPGAKNSPEIVSFVAKSNSYLAGPL